MTDATTEQVADSNESKVESETLMTTATSLSPSSKNDTTTSQLKSSLLSSDDPIVSQDDKAAEEAARAAAAAKALIMENNGIDDNIVTVRDRMPIMSEGIFNDNNGALFEISENELNDGTWSTFGKKVANNVAYGVDFLGEVFADFFGMTDSRYQYAVDAYNRRKRWNRDEKLREHLAKKEFLKQQKRKQKQLRKQRETKETTETTETAQVVIDDMKNENENENETNENNNENDGMESANDSEYVKVSKLETLETQEIQQTTQINNDVVS